MFMLKERHPFSVAMSVYKNDRPEQLEQALESICTQSLPANEIFLVIDGPIGDDLQRVIDRYAAQYDYFTIYRFEQNKGRGEVLRYTVEHCQHDLIAIMDSDDIAAPGRFRKQMEAYEQQPVDVIGGWTLGFDGSLETGAVSATKQKLTHQEIADRLPKFSPVSHVTALMRRDAILKAGNYQHLHYHEDYYLWVRMIEAGCTFRNLPEYLVYVRIGKNQAKRHGGWQYFKAGAQLRRYMLEHGLCDRKTYLKQSVIRAVYQLLLPPSLRNWVSMKFKRKFLVRAEVDGILQYNAQQDALFRSHNSI